MFQGSPLSEPSRGIGGNVVHGSGEECRIGLKDDCYVLGD